jgi:hypothetical protein
MGIQQQSRIYRVNVHCSPKNLYFVPGPRTEKKKVYRPSTAMESRTEAMWRLRNSSLIGRVTEDMSAEVLNGGKVRLGGAIRIVESRRADDVLGRTAKVWQIYGGIRSDDLVVVANVRDRLQVFVTECKGTIQARGFTRNTEAKMVYQSARTCELIRMNPSEFSDVELRGIIMIEIDHHAMSITINVNDANPQGLSGCVPDHWMYKSKGFASRKERPPG